MRVCGIQQNLIHKIMRYCISLGSVALYSMDGTYLVMKSTLAATGKALNKGKIMGSGIIIVHLAKD